MDRQSRTMHLSDGRRLGWAEYGAASGRPVLALHGAPACRLLFRNTDEIAAKLGLHVIAPDRPGYGLSDAMPGRTLDDFVGDAAELLDRLAIHRAPVIGISGGAPYAVATAAKLPARISGLALVSPLGEIGAARARRLINPMQHTFFVGLPRWHGTLRRSALMARRLFLVAPQLSFQGMAATLSAADRGVLAEPTARQLVIEVTREAVRGGVEGAISDLAIYGRPWGVDVGAIGVVAVLWQGTADRIVPAEVAIDLARRLPRCELRLLERQGHFWGLAHADEVLETVRERLMP